MTTRPPRPAAAEPRPKLPAPVSAVTGAFWGALSALRGGRHSLHPTGDAYEATFVTPERPDPTGAGLFDEPCERRALVRFSRGAGLPEPLPDVLGIAIRVFDAHGPGGHQDFLLATSSGLPIAHHALLPGTTFFGRTFSSVLVYSIGGMTRLVGAVSRSRSPSEVRGNGLEAIAVAAGNRQLSYDVCLAGPFGRFDPVARLDVGARIPGGEADRLRFNVWNAGGGIRPGGPFQGLRLPAYEGSQRHRPT